MCKVGCFGFKGDKMKSLRMALLSVMILSILGSLGTTNAQLLTTTEKIPLGELSKSTKCTHHTE